MATVLQFPQTPREYLFTDGYNLVDTGYRWAFGLPPDGQISSAACGAMPFRSDADRGLSAKCCLRGEDMVFLLDWEVSRATWTGMIWSWPIPDYLNETKGPSLHGLSCARN